MAACTTTSGTSGDVKPMNLKIPRVILLVAAAGLVVVAGLAALSRPRTALRLQALVSIAPGVRVGSTVLFRGIEVGRVSSITFADSGVRLGLELSRGEGSRAPAIWSARVRAISSPSRWRTLRGSRRISAR
jgi:ABC-type transporter Mla subunit MlaD